MTKVFKASLIGLLLLNNLFLLGCSDAKSTQVEGTLRGKISASGSSSLLPLLKAGQEDFYELHEQITINISAGGSFTGQNQVFSGIVDIGNSDVPLQDSLKGKGMIEHLLVGIPFVFIVNKDVTVDSLTREEYADILTGRITNWQQLGGADQAITVISRPLSSGARAAVRNVILRGERFTDNLIVQDSNGALRTTVATTPGAIGYVDAAYSDLTIKELAYNGIKYSVQNVLEGKYTIYTFGRIFTKGTPRKPVKMFIDYLLSEEFQNKHAEKQGFIPITKLKKNMPL